ncbi:hypothetical protein D3C78_1911200 [compost metagenome]
MHLQAGLFQHPIAYLQDHAVFFGEGDEVFWWHIAKGRVTPADQGFGAYQAWMLQADLRLVVQRQLVALDGAT